MSKHLVDDAIEQRKKLAFILYNPVCYTHTSWLHSWNISKAQPDRLINHHLIHQSETLLSNTENLNEANVVDCMHENKLLLVCLNSWDAIPKISYVLGAHYLRNLILKTNYVSHLNWQAIRFMNLPTVPCSFDAVFKHFTQVNEEVITATGMLILNALFSHFPKLLLGLLPLTLPESTYRLFLQYPRIKASARDRFLYKAALAHVENYCATT